MNARERDIVCGTREVCDYYCSTYYKAVREGYPVYVFITAVPITKLFARGGGGREGRTCATRDYEPRPV